MKRLTAISGSISILLLIVLWQFAASRIGSRFILPEPMLVWNDFLNLSADGRLYRELSATALRGVTAFGLSMAFSIAIGVPAALIPWFYTACRPWMAVIKATPVVSIILLALLWFGSGMVPVFVAILMTFPVLTEAIIQGVKGTDPRLLEMAQSYRMTKFDIIFHLHLPSALPYLLAGASASLGLTWKVVIAGEILAIPRVGLGSAMQTAKIHLETARVFSLTILAVLLCIATEWLFALILARVRRHRQPEVRV